MPIYNGIEFIDDSISSSNISPKSATPPHLCDVIYELSSRLETRFICIHKGTAV